MRGWSALIFFVLSLIAWLFALGIVYSPNGGVIAIGIWLFIVLGLAVDESI